MAVLVDGGFYLKRAKNLKGDKDPKARADELIKYCSSHVKKEGAELYRIFYYDCDPFDKKACHPLLNRTIDLKKQPDYQWKMNFFDALARKRKVAIRKGQSLEGSGEYVLKRSVARDLVRGKRDTASLTEEDFILDVQQKGVDVRIGLDLALIAHERSGKAKEMTTLCRAHGQGQRCATGLGPLLLGTCWRLDAFVGEFL